MHELLRILLILNKFVYSNKNKVHILQIHFMRKGSIDVTFMLRTRDAAYEN
jgi:hypothetical protein